MLIHQEEKIECGIEEVWINSDQILHIRKSEEVKGCYMVYVLNRNAGFRITQKTFEKITDDKGVV